MVFKVEYVRLNSGAVPARDFIDKLDSEAQAAVFFWIDKLRELGNRLPGNKVKKLTKSIFELRVAQNKREFRMLFFFAPNQRQLIMLTGGFVKKTQKTPKRQIELAERMRKWWLGD